MQARWLFCLLLQVLLLPRDEAVTLRSGFAYDPPVKHQQLDTTTIFYQVRATVWRGDNVVCTQIKTVADRDSGLPRWLSARLRSGGRSCTLGRKSRG